MARKFESGSLVWIKDPEECFVPAKTLKTFSPGEATEVELQDDGSVVELEASMTEGAQPMDPQSLESIENMVKINDLNEAAVLHDLRLRFKKDLIYTYVSSILVSVNPFKMLPIYTPEVLDTYIERGARDLPPHVFAIADNAYRSLLEDCRSQAVVISGESGAGKTEAMKLILQYLAEVSGRGSSKREGTESLEQQILKANPVMEAFGNAKTKRNNNSSRFGKWTAVDFNRGGTIIGGSIVNYLLEKSRVVKQAGGERNYHVFYQLCAGCAASQEMKALTKVGQPQDYQYLNQSDVTSIEGVSDEKDFEDLRLAMDVLQMTKEEQSAVFRTLAAVLHLGNLRFEVDKKATEEDGSRIANDDALQLVCEMIRTDADSLRRALTSRQLGAHSVVQVPYTPEQARDARDALSKTLYGKLFDWLIGKINTSLGAGKEAAAAAAATSEKLIIGVLDIFGFESFETNSFEQLCINYCNEKLQFHFNEHIFRLEQEEYRSEGIEVSAVDFSDNQPCLDLLELPRTGVFSMIDEEINVPRGSDDGFLRKVLSNHGAHPNLRRPGPREKDSRLCFNVVHYAGEVSYNATNFLEKNKDALHDDLRGAVRTSSEAFVVQLFADPAAAGAGAGDAKKRPARRAGGSARKKASQTLGSQFKAQLASLMETLNGTAPHFVRCMKPNAEKAGNLFQSQMMMAQLRYAGLLEVCRIRQIGFPIRRDFATFLHRYKCVAPAAGGVDSLLAALRGRGLLEDGQFAKGHSKVFLRAQAEPRLEKAREEALFEVTVRMQALVRRFVSRCRYRSFRRTREQLRAAVAARDEAALEQWLGMCAELPWRGEHLAEVREGRALGVRLSEERRVLGLLQEAMAARELSSLESAVGIAEGMAFAPPALEEARALVAALRHEKRIRDQLRAAVAARDRAELVRWLDEADSAGLESEEVAQARTLRARLEEEASALADLRGAMEARDLPELSAFLARMTEMGLDGAPDVARARALRDELQAQVQARHAVRAAREQGDADALEGAIGRAADAGCAASELEDARAELRRLRDVAACEAELRAAGEARDLARLRAALARAAELGMSVRTHSAAEDAELARGELEREAEALAALAAAAAGGGDQAALRAAVRRCDELGLGGRAEVAEAKASLRAAGQRGALQERVQAAAEAGDEAALAVAIAEAESQGLGESDEAREARETLARVREQGAALARVAAAAAGADAAALAAALKEATAAGAGVGGGRGAAEIKAARARLEAMRAADRVAQQIRRAIDTNDADALEQALGRAAAAEGVDAALVEEGRTAQAAFARSAELSARVRAALEADDEAALSAALEEAVAAGVESDAVRQGRIRVDRDRMVRETREALERAAEARDLEALNKAFAAAFELGLGEDALVERAKAVRQELQGDDEVRQELNAAVRTLRLKAEGPGGIAAEDVAPVEARVAELEAAGVAADEARAFVRRCHRQLEVQARLARVADAAAGATRREVAGAIEAADELQLELTTLGEARERLRELDAEHRKRVAEGMEEEDLPDAGVEVAEEEEEEDEDEVRRLRRERIERARNPKFHFTRFKRLRSSDDFARGVLLNKKKVKAHQFMWQAKVVPKSLTLLDGRDDNRIARNVHKALLGYCGDRSMSFPPMLANDILNKGLMHPALVDEIYVQICKHLTDNPGQESVHRAWQVMCMCVGTFPPSVDFQNHLMNFIVAHLEVPGPVGNYARYSLRRLEGIINSGSSGFVPSVDEIQAYNARPPILATVELVDGTPLTEELPVTPDLNCQKVMEICNHFLELQESRADQFGIFVYDTTDEDADGAVVDGTQLGLRMTPRPLRNEEFMGDAVVQKERAGRTFKFIYKRKVYLRNADPPSEDPMFERLVYLQAADEVIRGNVAVDTEEEVARLVAQSVAIDLGEETPEDADGLIEAGLMEYVPQPWRPLKDEHGWAEAVLAHRAEVVDVDPGDLQLAYVDAVRGNPLYGTSFFYVRKATDSELAADLPPDMICAFNSEGIHFLTLERELVVSYGFADIYRWGGSEQTFSLIIWSAEAKTTFELQLYTTQAADMAGLILDYITAIMQSTQES